MSTAEVAGEIGVSHGRVKQLVAEGKLPSELVGGRRFVRRDDLALARSLVRGRPGWPKGKPRKPRDGEGE